MVQNRNRAKPNRLVRLMIANWALGWAVGFVCASGVLLSNLSGLRDLMMSSQLMLQGLALLYRRLRHNLRRRGLRDRDHAAAERRGYPGKAAAATRAPILLPAYALAKIRAARA